MKTPKNKLIICLTIFSCMNMFISTCCRGIDMADSVLINVVLDNEILSSYNIQLLTEDSAVINDLVCTSTDCVIERSKLLNSETMDVIFLKIVVDKKVFKLKIPRSYVIGSTNMELKLNTSVWKRKRIFSVTNQNVIGISGFWFK